MFPWCRLGNLPYFYILYFDLVLFQDVTTYNIFQEVEDFVCVWRTKLCFEWIFLWCDKDESNSYVKMPRRLWTQTRVKGCPQRYLHCSSACASQWIISDKVIRPPIHMLLGVFSNPTSPLPASCPFREVVNTVVGVAENLWFIFKYILNPFN